MRKPCRLLVVETGVAWSQRLASCFAVDADWLIETADGTADVDALAKRLAAPQTRPDVIAWQMAPPALRERNGLLAESSAVPGIALLDAPADLAGGGTRVAMDALFAHTAPDEVRWRLQRCAEAGRAPAPARRDSRSPLQARLQEIAQSAPSLRPLLENLPRIAACNAAVLISGETGTGKELLARAVHYLSPRAHRPLVAVNCAALPQELADSEFFGHVRGAFTGAHQSRPGLIAEANEGTLFLDEVNSLPLPSQGKLLRFLQDHEYRPVGADRSLGADVRVVAATNVDIEPMVEAGQFRRDLYYRLKVLTLKLAALRDRPDDIAPLALHFVRRFAAEYRLPLPTLSPAALAALRAHDWPGNVREFEHAIERGCLMCRNQCIDRADLDLPATGAGPAAAPSGFKQAKQRVVDDFERGYLERLLSLHEGNVSRAAAGAHKNRRAFFELLRKHHIDPDRYRPAH